MAVQYFLELVGMVFKPEGKGMGLVIEPEGEGMKLVPEPDGEGMDWSWSLRV